MSIRLADASGHVKGALTSCRRRKARKKKHRELARGETAQTGGSRALSGVRLVLALTHPPHCILTDIPDRSFA